MTSLKSQILGLSLGFITAIGCIFYEKIVHNFSFLTFLLILITEQLLLFSVGYFIFPNELEADYKKFISEPKFLYYSLAYIATGATSILWFVITKSQGVMAGSLYEVKYIVIMALIYIAFGENKFTINTAIGLVLAMGSIYFISKI